MAYLLVFLVFTITVLLLPGRKTSFVLASVIVGTGIIIASWMAISVLFNIPFPAENIAIHHGKLAGLVSSCDRLSALFILIISFTFASGFIYSVGYLKPYILTKPAIWIKVHYLAMVWLYASMVSVVLMRNGFSVLIAWEIMTLSSFILVIFDFELKGTLQAGINYLIQMHIGMLFILFAFILSSKGSEQTGFDNLRSFFSSNPNWPVFLMFFIGFGLKAGFILLHTWLPEAHPAAPSHFSGIMSGVMIKLGIYGILRVSMYLQGDLYAIGAGMIIVSSATGLFGVMMAIFQHDVKKLLAYHSIENIGIIGLGIGLGIFGKASGNTVISVAGFAGAILHTLNHSLFKSLLFYSAGSVVQQLHTRDVEKMGGLIRYMPFTAATFLAGSIAICGLPPFNGFISEYLVYFSLFSGISGSGFYPLLLFSLAMVSLVLIGGLAIFCFTKVFSVMFLGQARTEYDHKPDERSRSMFAGKLLPLMPVILIGLVPVIFVRPLSGFTLSIFSLNNSFDVTTVTGPMKYISLGAGLLIAFIILIWMIRKLTELKARPVTGPTWGCGYTAIDARQQYTATSFVQEYAALIRPVIKNGASNVSFRDDELFPEKHAFHTSSSDLFRSKIIMRFANFMVNIFRKAAVFQTGKLQHYVLYALLFLVAVFVLTLLKLL